MLQVSWHTREGFCVLFFVLFIVFCLPSLLNQIFGQVKAHSESAWLEVVPERIIYDTGSKEARQIVCPSVVTDSYKYKGIIECMYYILRPRRANFIGPLISDDGIEKWILETRSAALIYMNSRTAQQKVTDNRSFFHSGRISTVRHFPGNLDQTILSYGSAGLRLNLNPPRFEVMKENRWSDHRPEVSGRIQAQVLSNLFLWLAILLPGKLSILRFRIQDSKSLLYLFHSNKCPNRVCALTCNRSRTSLVKTLQSFVSRRWNKAIQKACVLDVRVHHACLHDVHRITEHTSNNTCIQQRFQLCHLAPLKHADVCHDFLIMRFIITIMRLQGTPIATASCCVARQSQYMHEILKFIWALNIEYSTSTEYLYASVKQRKRTLLERFAQDLMIDRNLQLPPKKDLLTREWNLQP